MSNSLEWAEIAARLASARSYWLVTASERGVPHATPVWGAVLDGVLYLYTDRQSVKARNLAENPRLVVHLESGEDVLIVHGTAEDAGHPANAPGVLAALRSKYHQPEDAPYLPTADPSFDALYAVRPQRALAWRLADYEASQRRWRRSG